MSKKIYSRTITPTSGAQFVDRIQVEEINGVLSVTAHSAVNTGGALVNCLPIRVDTAVLELINGIGKCPYTLEP